MDEFVVWLRAQLDEDERIARGAAMAIGRTGYEHGELIDPPARFGDDLVADGAQWVSSHHRVMRKRLGPEEKSRTVADCGGFGARPVAVHAAEWDPARVLREIDAKRGTLKMAEECTEQAKSRDYLVNGPAKMALTVLKPVLLHLAVVYADRPRYEEALAVFR